MKYTLIAAAILTLAGCATQKPAAPPATGNPPTAARPAGAEGSTGIPAPGSKFAKLRIGMSTSDVTALIGPPASTSSHITGKSFIPFRFGGDTSRVEALYQNEGRLTYSSTHFAGATDQLIAIHVNARETGTVR